MTFGERLVKLREELKLTQGEFSQKLGVKYQTMSRYERNLIKPSFEFIKKIATLYPEKINWLLVGSELNNNVSNNCLDKKLIIDLNEYSDDKEIVEIIELLKFIPKKSLQILKTKLIEIKEKTENIF